MNKLLTRDPRGRFTKVLFEKTDKVFQVFANNVIKQAKGNLKRKKKGGGKLEKSLRATTIQEGKTRFELLFLSTDYGDFVNEGVKGKGGFKGSGRARGTGSPYRFGSGKFGGSWSKFKTNISKWITSKGIKGRDKKGKFISKDSLTYLIQRSIYQRGLERTLYFTNAFEKYYKQPFINKMETAYAEDVEDLLEKELEEQFNKIN